MSVHFATPLRIGCDMFAFSLLPTSGAVSPAGMAALASASAMDMVSRGIRGSNNTVNSDEQPESGKAATELSSGVRQSIAPASVSMT